MRFEGGQDSERCTEKEAVPEVEHRMGEGLVAQKNWAEGEKKFAV